MASADPHASLLLFLTGNDDIYVDAGWRPRQGDSMPQMPGCFVGKRFGAGALSMNSIYDVVDENGQSIGQALKVCKPSLAARRSLAHEWKMFKDLSMLGDSFPAARSHFLQAHRVIRQSNDVVMGIIMEKADGHNVVHTLKSPDFCNVRYVIALLRDLLVALDIAQRVLGFVHFDLKLDNLLEHWGCSTTDTRSRVMLDALPQFKLFDFGTAVVYPDPFSVKVQPSLHTTAAAVAATTSSNSNNPCNAHDQPARPAAAAQLVQAKQENTDKPGIVSHPELNGSYEYSEPFCCVRIYHLFWSSRGDVYRVLAALSRLLDDRTWPVEDLELVSLLLTVLEHCTNSRRLRARFLPRAALMKRLGIRGQLQPAGPASVQQQQQTTTQRQQQQQTTAQRQQQPQQQQPQPQPQHAAAPTAVAPHALQPGAAQGKSQVSSAPVSPYSSRLYAIAPSTPPTPPAPKGQGSSLPSTPKAAGSLPSTPRSSLHVPRSSTDARLTEVPGVAFARLSPALPSSPSPATAATSAIAATAGGDAGARHPAAAPVMLAQTWQECPSPVPGTSSAAAADTAAAVSAADVFTQANSPSAAPVSGVPGAEIAARRSGASSLEVGCKVDPAARVVAQQPLAPVADQTVLGSRKSVRGVTAQQLLAEPIVQSLLSKV